MTIIRKVRAEAIAKRGAKERTSLRPNNNATMGGSPTSRAPPAEPNELITELIAKTVFLLLGFELSASIAS